MARYRSYNSIANSFYAADRIRNIVKSPLRDTEESSIMESSYSAIIEILKVLSEFSPERHKGMLDTVVEKSRLYNDTYRNLKKHINSSRSKGIDIGGIIKTLAIIKPTLDNRHRATADKILKIYEILTN
ncbi:MAG: hypothetical protein N3I35_18385 [Clostridia bacterium]|nr:hypothetical protein [Clostridia bacterium]